MTTFTVLQTESFSDWLDGLRDRNTRIRLVARLKKVEAGLLGDVKPVGSGVFEMREFFGPGWRMYYTVRGSVIVVMLGGGDKSSQSADIRAAIEVTKRLED